MNSKLDSILHDIHTKASVLSKEDRDHLISALSEFAGLLRANDKSGSVSADLARVDKYLGRFKSASHARAAPRPSPEELLNLARSSSHSKWRFSKLELRRLQGSFWKALEANAEVWDPRELSNLLSYSLRRSVRIDFDRDTTSRTVAHLYHEYFKSLNHWERDIVFEELLQRVLSEPKFRQSLMAKERTE